MGIAGHRRDQVTRRTGRRAALAAGLVAGASLWVAARGIACGFHGDAAVGALNAAYPDALWVRTAVWQAQLDGVLPRAAAATPADPFAARVALARRYRAASDHLAALREDLASDGAGHGPPAFTVLLIGPMLWSRLDPKDGDYRLQVHADGAAPGDVVVITDEPVLEALADGRLRFSRALDLGLVRLYGKPSGMSAVIAALGSWRPAPSEPKSAQPRRTS